MNKEFYRGEIFYIRNESEYSGNVQGGGRPAVIISNDIGNNAGSHIGSGLPLPPRKRNRCRHTLKSTAQNIRPLCFVSRLIR